MKMENMNGPLYIILLVSTWVMLLLTFTFNALAGVGPAASGGLFTSSTGNVSDFFYIEITPAGWTFSIWGFIYSYQVIFLIYCTANIFRKSSEGVPLYKVAPFIHWSIFLTYIINLVCNISWILLWDRQHIIASLFPIALLAVTLYVCGFLSLWGIFKYQSLLIEKGFRLENRFVIGFVTNAFGMYGTWVSVATLLNFSMVLVYRAGMAQSAGSTVSLCILTFDIMAWALLDLAFIEKYTRFLFSPHAVLVVALIGSLSKNFNATKPNSIITVFLLVIVIVMLIVKIVLVVLREKKEPSLKSETCVKVIPE